jgi:hypothetical protein
MNLVYRSLTVLALIPFGLPSGPVVLAQDTAQQMPRWLQKQWTSSHNQWQRIPVDISKQTDTVSPDVRAKRNAYWMQYPQQMALGSSFTLPGAKVLRPEVDEIKSTQSIWVVARFEGVHVFALDPDSTELYTEMNMRVIDAIKSPDDFPVSAGSLLDILILGGTVKTVQGTVYDYRVEPHQFAAQPGHTYLLHLLYNPLYGTITTQQRWEISSGALVPDDEHEVLRAQEGKSMLAGKSVDEASRYIRSAL